MNLTQARAAVAAAKQQISTAYRQGIKLEIIAADHGLPHVQQVIHIARKAGLPPRRPDLSAAHKRSSFGLASLSGVSGGPAEDAAPPDRRTTEGPRP